MKKALTVIVLAMVAALALCLVGCGSASSLTQADIDSAKLFVGEDYYDLKDTNTARLVDTYDGKVFKVYGQVNDIDKDSVWVDTTNYSGNLWAEPVKVYLSNDDLVKLNPKDMVTAVGTLKVANAYPWPELHNAKLI